MNNCSLQSVLSEILLRVLPAFAAIHMLSVTLRAAEKPVVDRLFPAGGQVGSTVEVVLSGKPGDVPLGFWSDRGQLSASFSEKNDKATITIPADAVPGTHWVRFWNTAGASSVRAFVVGNSAEHSELEPNNRIVECTTTYETPCVINGVLEKSGDVDIVSVRASAGQTLVASVLANRDLASPMDSVLQLLDEQGNILLQNDDDQGIDPLITYPVSVDGVYRLRIFAFPSDPNSSIQFAGAPSYVYRMTIGTGTSADRTDPLAVQAGSASEVFLRGWNLPAEGLRIHIASPQLAAGQSSSRTLVPSESPLPVWINVVHPPVLTESAAIKETMPELPTPSCISGTISMAAEKDVWRFRAEPSTALKIQIDARRMGSLLDAALIVRNSAGNVLKEADDVSGTNLDVITDVKVPDDGILQVEVRDRFSHGGDRYYYLLSVTPQTPDVRLAVAESDFTGASDKPVELTVTIDRQAGFDRVLEFAIEGLPGGLQLDDVRSEKDGDSSKTAKLKISGAIETDFSGPIRILARDSTTGNTFPVMYSIPTVPNSSDGLHELWLTWSKTAP